MAKNELSPSSDDSISQRTQGCPSPSANREKVYIQLYAKDRSGDAQNHETFAKVISDGIGALRSKWDIIAELPDASRTVHDDIFLVQACAHFRDINGNGMSKNDVQNLRADIRKVSFFQDTSASPLFLCLREESPAGHFDGKLLAGDFLSGFGSILRGKKISTGESRVRDAIGETACTAAKIALVSYCIVKGSQIASSTIQNSEQPSQSSSTSSQSSTPGLTNTVRDARHSALNYVDEVTTTANALNTLSAQFREASQPEQPKTKTISQSASTLREAVPVFENTFNTVGTWMQLYEATSDKELSHKTEKTTVAMNELAPLFDKEHSKEKMAVKSVVAVAGLAAVSAIALCYFAPAGLGLTIMGESAVKWVGLHKVLSVTGAVAGTGATGIFGFQANTHSKQRNLMEQGA
ncbi:hypothetical protein H9L39_19559 [Fusarium oxysporum f. sp. albedinis]|nr:hypothetical protein H9L39_19559 [Fusarium oxysporum f. sp. albedinis]